MSAAVSIYYIYTGKIRGYVNLPLVKRAYNYTLQVTGKYFIIKYVKRDLVDYKVNKSD